MLVADTLKTLCLLSKEKRSKSALIDCACPTTVTGRAWLEEYVTSAGVSREDLKLATSEKIYKFGGGETRESLATVSIPCNIANINVSVRAEVVEADIPLLLGNTTLEKAKAVLDFGNKKAEFLGEAINMEKTESGHFRVELMFQTEVTDVCQDDKLDETIKEELVLLADNLQAKNEMLSKKNVQKIHHYLGHAKPDKLRKLIMNAKLLSPAVEKYLDEIGK